MRCLQRREHQRGRRLRSCPPAIPKGGEGGGRRGGQSFPERSITAHEPSDATRLLRNCSGISNLPPVDIRRRVRHAARLREGTRLLHRHFCVCCESPTTAEQAEEPEKDIHSKRRTKKDMSNELLCEFGYRRYRQTNTSILVSWCHGAFEVPSIKDAGSRERQLIVMDQ